MNASVNGRKGEREREKGDKERKERSFISFGFSCCFTRQLSSLSLSLSNSLLFLCLFT